MSDQLQEFILTIYLCIKGTPYPGFFDKDPFKIAVLKILSFFIVSCDFSVTVLINFYFFLVAVC